MNKAKQLDELKRFWNERNPQHEYNSDTEKDMFWETVLSVFNDLNKALSITAVGCQREQLCAHDWEKLDRNREQCKECEMIRGTFT
jgi:hypothetical protein